MRCPKSKAISSRSRERATEVRKQDLNGRAICCQMAHFLASAKLLLRKDPRNYLGGALPGPANISIRQLSALTPQEVARRCPLQIPRHAADRSNVSRHFVVPPQTRVALLYSGLRFVLLSKCLLIRAGQLVQSAVQRSAKSYVSSHTTEQV
jgi:hypothetical protein